MYNDAMHHLSTWPPQWKIAASIIGLLILIGLGVALQRTGLGGGRAPNLFGIQSAPSLTRAVSYSKDLAPDARDLVEKHINDLRAQLKGNPTRYDTWLDLAIRYKQAGDFAKTREVWEYLASIHPDDAVSRHNLGDLYHHFLKDYQNAEKYYKEAIDLAPTNALDYLALHELYRYSYKQDTGAAIDILKLGIGRVTEHQPIDLYIALAGYYGEKADKAKAAENYSKARDLARDAGNTKLVSELNAEIQRLR